MREALELKWSQRFTNASTCAMTWTTSIHLNSHSSSLNYTSLFLLGPRCQCHGHTWFRADEVGSSNDSTNAPPFLCFLTYNSVPCVFP